MRYLSLCLLSVLMLAACADVPISRRVPGFEIPTGSSGGQVCYVEVRQSLPVNFRRVEYEAPATYRRGTLGASSVEVVFYGRRSEPEGDCVTLSEEDLELSAAFNLRDDETKVLRIGDRDRTLADLVTQDRYWLGASLEDASMISLEGRIRFDEGVVRAFF